MKSQYVVSVMMLLSLLSGCVSDDQSTEPENELRELEDVRFALTLADLPVCDGQLEGRLYYVQSEESFHVCLAGDW
ncbi:MAG: hypothetical protein CMB61_03545, partial [Euryarchaeota archaeon]|nr:hypothetical protein [Euryarchaeota archaeon]